MKLAYLFRKHTGQLLAAEVNDFLVRLLLDDSDSLTTDIGHQDVLTFLCWPLSTQIK